MSRTSGHRAFVEMDLSGAVTGTTITLPAACAHRFATVLRLDAGAAVEVFCEAGVVVAGTFSPPNALVVASVEQAAARLPPLVLFQAMTKADKLEDVAKRATELGAHAVVLFDAARSQVHWDDDRSDKKRERLQRIAEDAARQCGRATVTTIEGPVAMSEVIARAKNHPGLVATAALDADEPLSKRVAADGRVAAGVFVVVGPEGGLTGAEVQSLAAVGAVTVRLGVFTLRTETAGLVALAAIQAGLGHL